MITKFVLALTSLALLGIGSPASSQAPADGPREHSRRPHFAQRGGERFERARQRIIGRREVMRRRIGERLGITDAQREELRARVERVRPIVEQTRSEAREILERARVEAQTGDRAAVRERTRGELKALAERCRSELGNDARSLVGTLTPEQRAKLEQAAAARGRQLDDERLERGARRLLVRKNCR